MDKEHILFVNLSSLQSTVYTFFFYVSYLLSPVFSWEFSVKGRKCWIIQGAAAFKPLNCLLKMLYYGGWYFFVFFFSLCNLVLRTRTTEMWYRAWAWEKWRSQMPKQWFLAMWLLSVYVYKLCNFYTGANNGL